MPRTLRRILAAAVACLAVFALDALVFRTRYYPAYLDPNSAAGTFEMILWRERQAQQKLGDSVAVTLGDSRFGIVPKLSNRLTPETGYVFRSAGVAGTDARAWYYMLRDLDPQANRYRAILLGVDNYSDQDIPSEPDIDVRAIYFSIARLRVTDAFDLMNSYRGYDLRLRALRGAFFKGIIYQNDFHEFLANPRKRIREVRFDRSGNEEWTYNYLGDEGSLTGLTIDWDTLTAQFPASFSPYQRDTVKNFLLWKPEPQTGRLAAFRREWFGRIIARYRNSRTKIIFVRLPRGPIPRPPQLSRPAGSVIREFAAQPGVLMMDEHVFEPIEDPEYFRDAMHMNKAGVAIFSDLIARETARMLGAPR